MQAQNRLHRPTRGQEILLPGFVGIVLSNLGVPHPLKQILIKSLAVKSLDENLR
jgi:hypothetical protein